MSEPAPVTDPDVLARFKAPSPVDDPDVLARFNASAPKHGMAADTVMSAGTGLVKGGLGLAGIGGDVAELGKHLGEKMPDMPSPDPDSMMGRFWKFMQQESDRSNNTAIGQVGHGDVPGSYTPPTSAQLQGSLEQLTGPLHEPETTPGRYAQSIGEFVPMAAATGGGGVVPNVVKGAVLPGAGSEFLGSKVEGTWMEPYARLLGALGGGVAGAAGGKVLGEIGANRSAASAAATEAGVPRGAITRMAKSYEADQLTPATIAARQAELGPEAMMMDMGRQMQGRAEAIASQPGKGQNKVLDAVEGRTGTFGSGTAARTKDTLDQVMGPSPDIVQVQKDIDHIVGQYTGPLYTRVMEAHPVVNVPEGITSRPAVQEGMDRAVNLAKNYGEDVSGQPSLRYWDYVKKAMDQRIRGMVQNGEDLTGAQKADLGGLQAARTALVNHLDDLTGGAYAVARKAAATKPEVKEALQFGRDSLNTKLLPEELADELQGMSLPQQTAVKAGMRREVERIIDTARNDGAAARRILDTNQNREKIVHVFGKPAADEIDRRIAAETHFQGVTNNVSGNSRTAVRQELRKDTEAPSQSGPPMANITGFAVAAARRGQQYLGDLSLERTKEGIADMLTRRGTDAQTLAQVLARYNLARGANAAPAIGQQARGLSQVLASQAPGWFSGYLPGPSQQTQ